MIDKSPKRNYFVPQFGEDKDITSTKASASLAEKQLNHVWDPSDPPKEPPRNYFVPHFGADGDMKNSAESIKTAEN